MPNKVASPPPVANRSPKSHLAKRTPTPPPDVAVIAVSLGRTTLGPRRTLILCFEAQTRKVAHYHCIVGEPDLTDLAVVAFTGVDELEFPPKSQLTILFDSVVALNALHLIHRISGGHDVTAVYEPSHERLFCRAAGEISRHVRQIAAYEEMLGQESTSSEEEQSLFWDEAIRQALRWYHRRHQLVGLPEILVDSGTAFRSPSYRELLSTREDGCSPPRPSQAHPRSR